MLTVKLSEDLKNLLAILQNTLTTLSQLSGIPAMQVRIAGSLVHRLYENEVNPNAHLEGVLAKTIGDLYIEPVSPDIILTMPQINQIATYLALNMQLPEPHGYKDYYHETMLWYGKKYYINVESKQKKQSHSIDARITVEGQLLISNEELFKNKVIIIPELSFWMLEYTLKSVIKNYQSYPAKLGYFLKTCIKLLRENYTLDLQTAIEWASFIAERKDLYDEIKNYLGKKPTNDIQEEEFERFAEHVIKIKKEAEIDKEHRVLFFQYWTQRIKEIKQENQEIEDLFNELMSNYNYCLLEASEIAENCTREGELDLLGTLQDYENMFHIPEIFKLYEGYDRSIETVDQLLGLMKNSLANIKVERMRFKTIAEKIDDKKKRANDEGHKRKEKHEKGKMPKRSNSSASASSSRSVPGSSLILSPCDTENVTVNEALKVFTQMFISILKETVSNKDTPKIFYEKLTKIFVNEYSERLNSIRLKAKFFSGIRNYILSPQGVSGEIPEDTRLDMLRSLFLYVEVNLSYYANSVENIRAFLVNSFDAFRCYRFLFPALSVPSDVADPKNYLLNLSVKHACQVLEIYIHSFAYNHGERLEKILVEEYEKMKEENIFSSDSLSLKRILEKGSSPNKRVIFQYSHGDFLVNPSIIRLFYREENQNRLREFNSLEESEIVFLGIIHTTIMEMLNNRLFWGEEFPIPSVEYVTSIINNYILEIQIENLGDNGRIVRLKNHFEDYKSRIAQIFQNTYQRVLTVSKEFTPHRIISKIFEGKDLLDDDAVLKYRSKNPPILISSANDCLTFDTSTVLYCDIFVSYIENLANMWPSVIIKKADGDTEPREFGLIMGTPGEKYFWRIMDALCGIPESERDKYVREIKISAQMKVKYPNTQKYFWIIIDMIKSHFDYKKNHQKIVNASAALLEKLTKTPAIPQHISKEDPQKYYREGVSLFNAKNYDSALKALNMALDFFAQQRVEPLTIAICLSTMASCYRDLRDQENALTFCVSAFTICKKFDLSGNEVSAIENKLKNLQLACKK